jgi:hypothetical protein
MSKPGRPTSLSNAAAEQNRSRKASKQGTGPQTSRAERQKGRLSESRACSKQTRRTSKQRAKEQRHVPHGLELGHALCPRSRRLWDQHRHAKHHTHKQEHTRGRLGGRSPRYRRVTRGGPVGPWRRAWMCRGWRCRGRRRTRRDVLRGQVSGTKTPGTGQADGPKEHAAR